MGSGVVGDVLVEVEKWEVEEVEDGVVGSW